MENMRRSKHSIPVHADARPRSRIRKNISLHIEKGENVSRQTGLVVGHSLLSEDYRPGSRVQQQLTTVELHVLKTEIEYTETHRCTYCAKDNDSQAASAGEQEHPLVSLVKSISSYEEQNTDNDLNRNGEVFMERGEACTYLVKVKVMYIQEGLEHNRYMTEERQVAV